MTPNLFFGGSNFLFIFNLPLDSLPNLCYHTHTNIECEYPAKVINIEFDPETNEVEWVGLEFDFYIDEKIKEKAGYNESWFSEDACNHTGTLGKCAWYNIDSYDFEKIF